MKPYIHAQNSVRKHKGKISDYIEIHNFMDSSKSVVPDMRHRAIFHSAFGCFIVEKVFGVTITNSDGLVISTRDIAEEHILEDLGKIPTLQDWLSEMNFQDWMLSPEHRKKIEVNPKNPCDEIILPESKEEEPEIKVTNEFIEGENKKPNNFILFNPPKGGLAEDVKRVMDGKRGINHWDNKTLD